METILTSHGKKILDYLVAKLPLIQINDLNSFPTYVQVLDALQFERHVGPTYGIALDVQGLANLAYWTIDRSLPAITGLIVDQQTHLPGQGFFEV